MDYSVNLNLGEIFWYVVSAAGMWKYFQKMGRQGWEGIVPLYNLYVLFEELYGSGWGCLKLLIPFYNIYVIIRLYLDLSYAFNQSTGFGWGLILLNPIFSLILGFGPAVYGDGSQAVYGDDAISRGLDDLADKVSGAVRGAAQGAARGTSGDNWEDAASAEPEKPMKASDIDRRLRELDQLRRDGILTQEEFDAKKKELLDRI